MIPIDELADPTVRAVATAINAGDRAAFLAAFTADPTLTDALYDSTPAGWAREFGHQRAAQLLNAAVGDPD